MNYSVETITEKNWPEIKKEISIPVTKIPVNRIINNENGNFLLELGQEHYSKENINAYRCLLNFSGNSFIIRINSENSSQADVFWEAWSDIQETFLPLINKEISSMVPVIYNNITKVKKIQIGNNPFEKIDEDTCINNLNSDILFIIDMQNTSDMNKYSSELIDGKKTFLMWKFYLLKYKGFKEKEFLSEKELETIYQGINYFPKRKAILLQHLENGGNKFSAATKKFVEYLRIKEISRKNVDGAR